jgi:catechol 2,3-dioxygenase
MTVHAHSESFATTRPVHVGRAHLVVRDLDVVGSFYEKAIGLERLEESASGIELGAGGQPLLTLTTRGDAAIAPRNAAGLYHTAFLMPNRQELAHWLAHAAHLGIELDGASDHLVSEAIYLSDPEGNGIEIYRDRSHMEWNYFPDGTIQMDTRRLDLKALYESAPKAAWSGMTPDVALGHIHLQVGNVPEADRFYEGVLGLKKMTTYPGASFYSSGAYHHHVAANVWNSRNASARSGAMTGLQDYELAFNDQTVLDGVLSTLEGLEIKVDRTARGYRLTDPWSIGLTLVAPQA